MTIGLPEVRLFRQRSGFENGWSDHYGALQLAAAYSGHSLAAEYTVNAIWQHGCFGPWHEYTPGVLVYQVPGVRELRVFVARAEQVDYLRSQGQKRVSAIGMPIIYTPEHPGPRIPSSLLVVPTHSLVGFEYSDRAPFERYADQIREMAVDFENVVVCVHPNCRKNGLWINEFSERGFEIVDGALTNDANALLRMRALFEQFESVTTNDWGSHVAYALAFGAKVSIAGFALTDDRTMYLRDRAWAANPAALQAAFSPAVLGKQREFLARCYVPPQEAITDRELGRWLIGAGHKVSPEEMADLLGDIVNPPPSPLPGSAIPRRAAPGEAVPPRASILFVVAEANRSHPAIFLLHFLQWLRRFTDQAFEVLVGRDGPLIEEFALIATVHRPRAFAKNPQLWDRFKLVYANTCGANPVLANMACGEIPIVTHVHDLAVAYDRNGARELATTIRQSNYYLAGSQPIADQLSSRFGIASERVCIPWGAGTGDESGRALWDELRRQLLTPAPAPNYRNQAEVMTEIYATWSAAEVPPQSYVAAHLARARARQKARALAQGDRRNEAIQTLVRAVGADIASKDPLNIFESLVQIGDDLAPLEARISARLLGDAEKISRNNPSYRLSDFRPAAACNQRS